MYVYVVNMYKYSDPGIGGSKVKVCLNEDVARQVFLDFVYELTGSTTIINDPVSLLERQIYYYDEGEVCFYATKAIISQEDL